MTNNNNNGRVFSGTEEPQDSDYYNNNYCYSHNTAKEVGPQQVQPQLLDELEAMILARVPRADHPNVAGVNKRFLWLIKSGEINKLRRDIKRLEPTVFMLPTGGRQWWAFDGRGFRRLRNLPELPADESFHNGDKETLCAGTHLLVFGREDEGVSVIWRYDLVGNQWLKTTDMFGSRSIFASATCGGFGYVAGGISNDGVGDRVVDLCSAERYNCETEEWEILPNMHKRRKHCSGCHMDNRFYVIGGRNDEDGQLTCAEAYDDMTRTWELIPDMLEGAMKEAQRSPPLIAVVENELYSLDASANEIKVYLKGNKRWRSLGTVPVIADKVGGWGVAFKSLGDELVVIGGSANAFVGPGMIYVCRPDPTATELVWRLLEYEGNNQFSPFILNCAVMFV